MMADDCHCTRNFIIKSLCMQAPEIIYVPPIKDSILYSVVEKPKVERVSKVFKPIIEKLIAERSKMSICCKTYTSIINISSRNWVNTILSPRDLQIFIVLYTHCTHQTVKDKIIHQFTKPSSPRVIIATIAFGMGINCMPNYSLGHSGRCRNLCTRKWEGRRQKLMYKKVGGQEMETFLCYNFLFTIRFR